MRSVRGGTLIIAVLALGALAGCGGDNAGGETITFSAEPSAPQPGGGSGGARLVKVGDFDQPLYLTQPPGSDDLYVVEQPGRVLTRAQLIDRAYPGEHHVSERTIDTHVRNLRAKLGEHRIDPIETVHGLGYRCA